MPTSRGALVLAGGVGLWVVARILGSPTIHIIAVGLTVLPLASWVFVRRRRLDLHVRRHLSDVRVPPGRRVFADLEIENRSGTSTSLLLVEDHLPSTLAPPARLVLPGIPAARTQRIGHSFVPRGRGRYPLGPVAIEVSDPFALTRHRVTLDVRDEIIVTPEVEDLRRPAMEGASPLSGASRARTLLRGGDEFYTMRAYQEGDDLRRIHWPSVARSGRLMIRQDEASRRGTATMLLDTRRAAVGQAHGPCFERCVSVAASIGTLLARAGFSLKIVTTSTPLVDVGEDQLMDALAGVHHDTGRALGPALTRLRAGASPEATLVAVTAPPPATELTSLIRTGSGFGPRVAVLVYPTEPSSLPQDRQAQLEGRASQARLSLSRAGWDVLVLPPSGRLEKVWRSTPGRIAVANA